MLLESPMGNSGGGNGHKNKAQKTLEQSHQVFVQDFKVTFGGKFSILKKGFLLMKVLADIVCN